MRRCINSCVRLQDNQTDLYAVTPDVYPGTPLATVPSIEHPMAANTSMRTAHKEMSNIEAPRPLVRGRVRDPPQPPMYHVYEPSPQLFTKKAPACNAFKMAAADFKPLKSSSSSTSTSVTKLHSICRSLSSRGQDNKKESGIVFKDYVTIKDLPDADTKHLQGLSSDWGPQIENFRKVAQQKMRKDTALRTFQEELLVTDYSLATQSEQYTLPPSNEPMLRIAKQYIILNKLGSGSFGEIYKGYDMHSRTNVAIKFEHMMRPNPHLLYEAKVYSQVKLCKGVPKIHWFGVQGEYYIMVMDLKGPSLEQKFIDCGRKLPLILTLKIGLHMVRLIEEVHKKGSMIHRDVKPHNFLMGLNENDMVYLIDFGLAKKYLTNSGNHIKFIDGKSLTGTARYVSIATHNGHEQSRRDDLESVGYVLLYFVRGRLPWEGIQGADKRARYEAIRKCKINTTVQLLCKGLPMEFQNFINDCREYQFNQTPDYKQLRNYLETMLMNEYRKKNFAENLRIMKLVDRDWPVKKRKGVM